MKKVILLTLIIFSFGIVRADYVVTVLSNPADNWILEKKPILPEERGNLTGEENVCKVEVRKQLENPKLATKEVKEKYPDDVKGRYLYYERVMIGFYKCDDIELNETSSPNNNLEKESQNFLKILIFVLLIIIIGIILTVGIVKKRKQNQIKNFEYGGEFMRINNSKIFFIIITVFLSINICYSDITISNCGTINTRFETYYLDSDIIDYTGNPCIQIENQDIILDCQGHIIDGVITGSPQTGIRVGHNNITVRNCTISDFITGISIVGVFDRTDATDSYINNVTIYDGYYGITTNYGNNTRIVNVTISDMLYNGISSSGDPPDYDEFIYIINSTIYNCSKGINNGGNAVNETIKNNNIYDNAVGIDLHGFGDNYIYNNLLNNSVNIRTDGEVSTHYLNTTKQLGNRIYGDGTHIGGNFYTNSTGNGYSDTCTDADTDGFCDDPFVETAGYPTAEPITDYLPLSSYYVPPEEGFYCGEIGICTNNIMCLLQSLLESTITLIVCISPAFILFILVGIATALLLGFRNISKL